MTAVLLIADTGRVQRVFADLESRGVLQLHAAATLTQVDQKLAACSPEFAFVQGRISGLSTAILLRHLKKALPEETKVVFLSADAADVPRKAAAATPFVDLRLPDDLLADTVAGIVTGTAPPPPGKVGKGAVLQKGAPVEGKKRPQGDAHTSQEDAGKRKAKPKRSQVSSLPQPAVTAPLQGMEADSLAEAVPEAPSFQPSPAGTPAVAEGMEVRSFLEIMDAASAKVAGSPLDGVAPGGEAEGAATALASSEAALEAEPLEPRNAPRADEIPPVEDQADGATLGSGQRKRPRWLIALLLAFLVIPSAAYLLGRAKAPEPEAGKQHGTLAHQRTPLSAAGSSVAERAASKVATGTPERAHKREPHPSGLAALPPFLEGVDSDRGYSAGHPGWERYLGARAEYKLFREGGRYRAIQAIARGDEIPDQLFRRVLLEFGGIVGYGVKSIERKGNYLVEQATGSGSASLTIYRKTDDQRIKGLVVYYH